MKTTILGRTGMRVSQWDQLRTSHLGLQVYAADTRPDRTVPSGNPPQRRIESQGRPQDVEAALEAQPIQLGREGRVPGGVLAPQRELDAVVAHPT